MQTIIEPAAPDLSFKLKLIPFLLSLFNDLGAVRFRERAVVLRTCKKTRG